MKPPSAPTNDAVITDKQEVVEEEESEDEDEYENAADGDLSAIQSSFMEHCKLVRTNFCDVVRLVNCYPRFLSFEPT